MPTLNARETEKSIFVSFSGFKDSADFFNMVKTMKSIKGYWYHFNKKEWELPNTEEAIETLINVGFPLERKEKPILDPEPIKILSLKDLKLKKQLKPFQVEGISFLEKQNGRGLIADEMGLGKTLQAIGFLTLHPELRPAVIICPASAKFVWQKEFRESTDEKDIEVLEGRNGKSHPTSKNITIVNFDILKNRLTELKELAPKIIIIDESHAIKDPSAQRTKAVRELCDKIPHLICLSGTPIKNRPIEFFTTLNLLDPYLFPSRFKFAIRFCEAKKNRWGWDMRGSSNTEELHRILTRTIMIRRMKSDVLKELPPKTRTAIPLEIDNRKEYQEVEKNVIKWIWENEGLEAAAKATRAEYIVQLSKLKQAAARGKMKSVIKWIEDFIDTGEKLILFCVHTEIVDALYEHFKDVAIKYYGATSRLEREEAVNAFQGDAGKLLFIGNIKAAGEAITLHAASNVAFMEFDWTPGSHLQAEDRAHRIGQKNCVSVYYLIAKGTIDEKIVKTLESKAKVLDKVLDGKESKEENIFNEILNGLLERKS